MLNKLTLLESTLVPELWLLAANAMSKVLLLWNKLLLSTEVSSTSELLLWLSAELLLSAAARSSVTGLRSGRSGLRVEQRPGTLFWIQLALVPPLCVRGLAKIRRQATSISSCVPSLGMELGCRPFRTFLRAILGILGT